MWALLPADDGPVHLTRTDTHRRGRPGIRLHQSDPPHQLAERPEQVTVRLAALLS